MVIPPQLAYCGLTVVLSHPSRFDDTTLLSGKAGNFFDAALSPVANRYQCYLTTADQFDVNNPPNGTRVVLLLGEHAHRKFFGREVSLMEQRGSPATCPATGITYISTIFPQDAEDRRNIESKQNFHRIELEREDEADEDTADTDEKSTHGKTKRKNYKFWLRKDIKKTAEILRGGLKVVTPELEIYPSPERVIEELTNTKNTQLYFDIENDPHLNLTCFGYSFSDSRATCVPMYQTHYRPKRYFYDDLTTCRLLRALAIALRDNEVVIHNAMWDLLVLCWKYRIPLPRKIFCTMVAWNRLFPEVEKSLGHVLSFLTHQPYHKNEGAYAPYNNQQAENLYRYNAKDVASLPLIFRGIHSEAARLGAANSIAQANASIRPYLIAELQGLRVDREAQNVIRDRAARRTVQMERLLRILVGFDLNPRSPKQVAAYLYDKRRIAERPAKDLTASKTLLQLYLKTKLEVIPFLLEARGQGMKRSKVTFVDYPGPRLHYKGVTDERFSCRYNVAGTNTFRLSSAKLISIYGNNSQNFEKELRRIIVPDPGKTFIQVDQSGAEALVVAWLCRSGNFRGLFAAGIKSHTFVAMHLFRDAWEELMDCDLHDYINAPVTTLKTLPRWKELEKHIKSSDKWPANKRYYHIAKMVCHASNYGMKAPTFRLNVLEKSEGKISLSLQDAQFYLTTYHRLFPEIQLWHVDTIQELRKNRILRNLFGFPRVFTGPEGDDLYKEAYAFVPQSTVGTISNMCFTECQERCETDKLFLDAGVDMLQNNHDSVLAQCRIGYEQQIYPEIQKHMNREMVTPRGERFSMKSGVSIGDNWADVEEL